MKGLALLVLSALMGIIVSLAIAPRLSTMPTQLMSVTSDADSGVGFAGTVNRDTQTQPRDFCMFSALYNGLEGDVYVDDVNGSDGYGGCTNYRCSIVADKDRVRRYYVVTDCGESLNTEGW